MAQICSVEGTSDAKVGSMRDHGVQRTSLAVLEVVRMSVSSRSPSLQHDAFCAVSKRLRGHRKTAVCILRI